MNISGVSFASTAYEYSGKPVKKDEMTFAESLDIRKRNADSFAASSKREEPSPQDMTMEEYRLYIYGKISAMSGRPSRNADTMILISDEGYAAMKKDPGYEKWVLNRVKETFSANRTWLGRDEKIHTVQFIGASEEECRCESWSSDEFKGPTSEEIRRFRLERKAKAEKLRRYRKVLQENSIKRADKELDHIKGIYRDYIYKQKNVCAEINRNGLPLDR